MTEDYQSKKPLNLNKPPTGNVPYDEFINIKLQDGPIKENGINGCQIDHVIYYLINILHDFQTDNCGKFSCRENSLVITKLEEAIHWLHARTQRRMTAGVEGTSKTTIDEGIKSE